jgi:hypothetical protein
VTKGGCHSKNTDGSTLVVLSDDGQNTRGLKRGEQGRPMMKFKLLIGVIAALSLTGVVVAAAKSPHKRAYARPPVDYVDSPEVRYRNDPYAVWVAGTYVGRDPDPNVRAALIRDFNHNLSNR